MSVVSELNNTYHLSPHPDLHRLLWMGLVGAYELQSWPQNPDGLVFDLFLLWGYLSLLFFFFLFLVYSLWEFRGDDGWFGRLICLVDNNGRPVFLPCGESPRWDRR